jgi:hypothetical protein
MAKKRTRPCPYCTGEKIINPKQEEVKTNNGAQPYTPGGALSKFAASFNKAYNTYASRKKKNSELIPKCDICNNTRKIEDTTDRSEQIEAAGKEAEALKDEILKLEAELGPPGGNRHTLVVGDEVLEVGLGYNDTPSYTIVKDGGLGPATTMEKEAPMNTGTRVDAVVGTNPLATPGGNYTVKCANKYMVRAGAHGIELSTEGPLIIKAGQTQITGPEVTIGSSVGPVAIEGQSLSINGGKCLQLNAGTEGSGQISANGTFTATGNMVAQGGAHFDGDVSCVSMTMPGTHERSEHAAQDTQTSGAPAWGGECADQGLKDFKRVREIRKQDAANLVATPREQQNIASEQKALLKKSQDLEPQPTGLIIPGTQIEIEASTCPCNQGGTASGRIIGTIVGPGRGVELRNFPHHHGLSDMVHAHDNFVPNINKTKTADEVRQLAGQQKTLPAPAPAIINTGNSNLLAGMGSKLIGMVSKVIN